MLKNFWEGLGLVPKKLKHAKYVFNHQSYDQEI